MKSHVSTILETKAISKSFGDIMANADINFKLNRGEVHAILGENGAGKSTLLNIIYGLYRSDKGDIFIHGKKANIKSPFDAIRQGIHMVHQNFMLIPVFTVLENIILGNEPIKGISIDKNKANNRIKNLMKDFQLYIDPNAITENLPVGIQQRVEIMKGLYRDAKILLLDEPTSALTPQEVEDFFTLLKRLSKMDVSIVFITHKLKEVLTISDQITVMRHGKIVERTTPSQTNENKLVELMVGRKISPSIQARPTFTEKIVLKTKNLFAVDDRNTKVVRDVSFNIHEGEILGIAGVQGNGQSELAEALTGLRDIQSGTVCLDGNTMFPMNPRMLYEHGLGHIPENRLKHGLVASYSIADNQILCSYYKPPFAGKVQRNTQAIMNQSKYLIEKYRIHAPGPETPVENLSGGNQQKVVLSRELNRNLRFLVANQPTRGLDVASIVFFHSQLVELKNRGVAILLMSSDLDEIYALSDRIAVMFEGRMNIVAPVDQISRNEIGLYMSGSITSTLKERC